MKNGDRPINPIYNPDDRLEVVDCSDLHQGLTKREHFAAMAMQSLLSNPTVVDWIANRMPNKENIKHFSYEYADALLIEEDEQ
jgi:hypothetical protein